MEVQRGEEIAVEALLVQSRPEDLSGQDVAQAAVTSGEFGWPISLTFGAKGTEAFRTITAENVGKRLAMVIDGEVHSAPVIKEAITGGKAQIGRFSLKEAKLLAAILEAGEYPVPVRVEVVEEEPGGEHAQTMPDSADKHPAIARQLARIDKRAAIEKKLVRIILPEAKWEEALVGDALQELARQSVALDPEGEGVKIDLRFPAEVDARTVTMDVTDISLGEAIHYPCKGSALESKVQENQVVVFDRSALSRPSARDRSAVRRIWMAGFAKLSAAGAAEKEGDVALALRLYREALAAFEKVSELEPDWSVKVVEYRTSFCAGKIAELERKLGTDPPER